MQLCLSGAHTATGRASNSSWHRSAQSWRRHSEFKIQMGLACLHACLPAQVSDCGTAVLHGRASPILPTVSSGQEDMRPQQSQLACRNNTISDIGCAPWTKALPSQCGFLQSRDSHQNNILRIFPSNLCGTMMGCCGDLQGILGMSLLARSWA